MATSIPLSKIEEILRLRIERRILQFQPNSPELRKAVLRIGFLLETEIKLNIRKKTPRATGRSPRALIDTGRLINSIGFNVNRKGPVHTLTVGSFSVPYAAVHEFGFSGIQRIRQHRRLQTEAFGKKIPPRSVTVRAHGRRVNIPARPFIRPAIKKRGPRIVTILADLFRAIR